MKARAIPYNTEVCGSFRVLSVAVAMPLMASRGRRFKACPRYYVMSQDIGNCRTCNCGSGSGPFWGLRVGLLGAPVPW